MYAASETVVASGIDRKESYAEDVNVRWSDSWRVGLYQPASGI